MTPEEKESVEKYREFLHGGHGLLERIGDNVSYRLLMHGAIKKYPGIRVCRGNCHMYIPRPYDIFEKRHEAEE